LVNLDAVQWKHVAVTDQDDIVELRFHTDDGPMVWTADTHREAYEAFAWAGLQPAKVVIVTGTGEKFCTDIDVTSFTAVPWETVWWEGRRMLKCLNDIEVPVISAVNGPALIHAEILAMGDIVLASSDAQFADRAHFAVRDTVPGDGANLVWGELLGSTRSKYFLMTGSAISADEALRIGFVNEVLEPAGLRTRAWELAHDLARRSLPVLRYTKAATSIGFRRDFDANLSHGLGIEGCGHWSRGGLRPGLFSSNGTGSPAPSSESEAVQ
jgi:enoyl-CoA hydratase/carnithine racemase